MKSDYDYYLIGCEGKDYKPLTEWRFRVIYAARQHERKHISDVLDLPLSKRNRALARLVRQVETEDIVRLGQQIAGGVRSEDEDGGAAACGVREPRIPLEPVLVGCAARSLPTPDAPDEEFWRV